MATATLTPDDSSPKVRIAAGGRSPGGGRDLNGEPPLRPELWPERHGDALFRYAMSRLRDRDAAEEVVQETFVSGIRAAEQFTGEGVEGAWLMGILRRKVIDYVRKRNKALNEPDADGEDISSRLYDQSGNWRNKSDARGIPGKSLESEDFYRQLHSCIDGLPKRQGMAFVLRELEQLSTEEICQTLDVEPSNLSVLLYRARNKLASCLTAYVERGEAVADG